MIKHVVPNAGFRAVHITIDLSVKQLHDRIEVIAVSDEELKSNWSVVTTTRK